jgi:sec-independent protein translocase protein TatA
MLLFLDFSGGEFLLIAVVFLMFFGSKSIPGMARALGKAVREFKEAANTVQREIHESATIEEVKEIKQTTSSSQTSIPQQTTPSAPSQPETNADKGEVKSE